jgi:hypothetical protein
MTRIAFVVVLALWPACGGGSDGGASPDAALGGEDAALADAEAADLGEDSAPASRGGHPGGPVVAPGCAHTVKYCEKMNECMPFYVRVAFGDVATCGERVKMMCTDDAMAPGSGITEASIEACAESLAKATCDDVLGNRLGACSFRGSLPDGSKCGANGQCASGLCRKDPDRAVPASFCGTCAPRGAAGEPCRKDENEDCQNGLVCAPNLTCVAPGRAGEKCDSTSKPCLMNLYCTTAQTCAFRVAVGEPCTSSNDYDDPCDRSNGAFCHPGIHECIQIGTARPGERCGLAPPGATAPVLCAPGGFAAASCIPEAGGLAPDGSVLSGVCGAVKQDGEPCETSANCIEPATCVRGICYVPASSTCK